jgi:hypothetical protein
VEDGTAPNGGPVLRQTESQETVIQQTDSQETVIQKEESIASDDSKVEPFAPTVAPSPLSVSERIAYHVEEARKLEEEQFTSSQSTLFPIDSVTTGKTSTVENKSFTPVERPKPSSKPKQRDTEPLMPLPDAPWTKETAVQIVEAKKGRIYSKATRTQELTEAGKVLEMTIDGTAITREQFERAWDEIASSSWWDEHGKPCMIKYLRRDDTIVGIIKKPKRTATQKAGKHSVHGTASHDSYTRDERIDLLDMSQEERKMYNQKRREAREKGQEVF